MSGERKKSHKASGTPREQSDDGKAKRTSSSSDKGKLQKQVPSLDLKDQMNGDGKKKSVGASRSPRGMQTKRDDENPESAKKSARPPSSVKGSSSKYPTARGTNPEKHEPMSDVNLKRMQVFFY